MIKLNCCGLISLIVLVLSAALSVESKAEEFDAETNTLPNSTSSSYSMAQEIDHLLNFVRTSSCIFIRNGSEYRAKKAASHIQRKYEHYEDEIDSTEMFIELSASKSTMSKKPYHIKCGDQTHTSQQWLLNELNRFRNQ